MSNFQEKDDWWLGADGKWRPPVAKRIDPLLPEEQVHSGQVKPNILRKNQLGVIAAIITVVGVFVYQSRVVETRTMEFGLELIDQSPGEFGWSVQADCNNVDSSVCRCELSDLYSDLSTDTEVVVFSGSGEELARTTLKPGRIFKIGDVAAVTNPDHLTSTDSRKCEWVTPFIDLPINEDSYLVKFGSRGEISFDSTDQSFLQMLTIEDD